MHAKKVRDYRADLLSEPVFAELEGYVTRLKAVAKGKDAVPAESAADDELQKIHQFLIDHGGKIYPRTNLIEFAEMVIFSALVIIGIRSFFLQPFIIPTNSMYPTYNGMLTEVHEPSEVPNLAEKAFRLVTRGARNFSVDAPQAGRVHIPISLSGGVPIMEEVPGRRWFVFPAVKRRLHFSVDDEMVHVDVPREFDPSVIYEALSKYETGKVLPLPGHPDVGLIETSLEVDEGEPLVNFDILLGDALFVDRISYHFTKPKVGDPFVFTTDEIPTLGQSQYYIKRLVGEGGDVLRVDDPVLYRNEKPIEGVMAFEKNNRAEGEYEGYENAYPLMGPSAEVEIPKDHFFAMGDNSDNSLDSRRWGHVPKKSVVGRAIFIYYPFTDHWGPAK